MLALRRGCLGYSKVCDIVMLKKIVPGMGSKQSYFVLYIPYSVY